VNVWLNRLTPDFTLPGVVSGRFSLSDLRGYIIIVNFWSAECAWSRRADVFLIYRLLTWQARGVRVVGVAANAGETENQLRLEMEARHLSYPVVMDHNHRIADLYKAETTPHFFVLDRQGLARYIGALDDATAEEREARTFYLDRAVAALLDERTPDPAWTPAYGCPIERQAGTATNVPAAAGSRPP
jgi:peroxiredoxin